MKIATTILGNVFCVLFKLSETYVNDVGNQKRVCVRTLMEDSFWLSQFSCCMFEQRALLYLYQSLNTLPREHEQIFKHYRKLNYLRRSFDRYRKRATHKLGNPRILKITFHTLRHWKATIEYHKTKDILYVMRLLGHRNIKHTLLYTQLVKPNDDDDEYFSKVARTVNEARRLVENGFEYVCDIEGAKLFRKRK